MTDPLRLLFDENLSPNVAKALRLLDKDVRYIGRGGLMVKGSTDEEIAGRLVTDGRYMFTKNFDMVISWADEGGRFIWLDPRYEPTKYQQARLVFSKWDEWERALSAEGAECLRVGMSTIERMSAEEGRAHAAERFERQKSLTRRRAAASLKKPVINPEQGSILDYGDEDN